MKAASVNELKKELARLDDSDLLKICMRLAKYKKENKELISYLLFEADDEESYVSMIRTEMDEQFETLPKSNVYLIKKVLRKILRIVNKQIKYSDVPKTELELRIYFCQNIKKHRVPLTSSQVLTNVFLGQLKKIETVVSKLPEDLQFDYESDLQALRNTPLIH
jgi:hypothetical protein